MQPRGPSVESRPRNHTRPDLNIVNVMVHLGECGYCVNMTKCKVLLQKAHEAMIAALRREDDAAKRTQRLRADLAATQGLLTANQRELQRNLMVMKFRNAEVERLRVSP